MMDEVAASGSFDDFEASVEALADTELVVGRTACSALQSHGGRFKPIHFAESTRCE